MPGMWGPGTILLGKYRVESVLGRGGMGIVLRVTHLHLVEELALKILSAEGTATPEVTARFLREAQSTVRLRGEHVARVTDVGLLPEGVPYMVMEYLRGQDLAGELRVRTALPPGEAVDYVLQACEALAEAHTNGIVHRDIKPANLFLTARPDGTPLIKVLDFGISKSPISPNNSLTKTDSVMGTPGYMSPEQMKASKDVDARTDIWSLGVVLYECLTGRRPFEGESFSAIVLMAGTEPPPPMDPRIPRGLQAVVLRCLEKDRRARFASIAELAVALAPFARDQRSAAVVVDRTSLLRQGTRTPRAPTASPVPGAAPSPVPSPDSTTLSGSAGDAGTRSRRRRYVIAGMLSVIGSMMIVIAALSGGDGHAQKTGAASDRPPSLEDAGGLPHDRVVVPSIAMDAAAPPPTTITIDAAAAPAPVQKTYMDLSRKVTGCSKLGDERKWQALHDCASDLEVLGVKDGAQEFKAMAAREQANERHASTVLQALRDKDLKAAETALSAIGEGSVYYAESRDELAKAEAPVREAATRKAQALAKTHNCEGLKRFAQEQAAVSTQSIAAAVQSVGCSDKVSPASPPLPRDSCDTINVDDLLAQAQNQFTAGYAKSALALMTKALVCKQDVRMYRLAVSYACAAHDAKAAQFYLAEIPAQYRAAIIVDCAQENVNLQASCNTTNVDDLITQAQNQFSAGFAKSGLSLMTKALACKQDVRMYRLAANYACAARDSQSASFYYAKVPSQFQAAIEQKCQQEGITLRSP